MEERGAIPGGASLQPPQRKGSKHLIPKAGHPPPQAPHLRRLLSFLDGKQKIMFALTSIKGIGRRFTNICCKKADT